MTNFIFKYILHFVILYNSTLNPMSNNTISNKPTHQLCWPNRKHFLLHTNITITTPSSSSIKQKFSCHNFCDLITYDTILLFKIVIITEKSRWILVFIFFLIKTHLSFNQNKKKKQLKCFCYQFPPFEQIIQFYKGSKRFIWCRVKWNPIWF